MSKLQDMKIHTGKTMLFFCILQLFALISCSDDEELGNLPEEPTQTGSSYGELEANDFVATGDVKDISYTAGTALCSVNADKLLGNDYRIGVVYSDEYDDESTLTYDKCEHQTTNNVSGNRYEVELTGLQAATTYHYRSYVYVEGNYHYGGVKSFTTHDPSRRVRVATGDITGRQQLDNFCFNARLHATVDIEGDYDDMLCGFIYYHRLNGDGTLVRDSLSRGVTSYDFDGAEFSADLNRLDGLTTWYYRAYVSIGGKNIYGEIREIKSTNVSLVTGEATDVKATSATLNATVDMGDLDSLAQNCEYGFMLSKDKGNVYNGERHPVDYDGTDDFSLDLTNLDDGTTYYYQAYIRVKSNYYSDRYVYGKVMQFTTQYLVEQIEQKGAVDLGLPSGTKWAAYNVGAARPMQIGKYYSWGELEPKSVYTEDNSKTYGIQLTDISGNEDYDVASAKWGGGWRLPTKEEAEELRRECTWTQKTYNGVDGYVVTGKNGKSIFLPETEKRNDDPNHKYDSSYIEWIYENYDDYLYGYGNSDDDYYENYYEPTLGYYWTSTPSSASYGEYVNADSYAFDIAFGGGKSVYERYRYFGLCVRPVCN